ncbi:extracellular solute-binding protein [Microbulbifer hydrolyticus]|uniref:Extracellular solute-binding protein n=1 Tax=Microbulbifer hydrolyticus TaxID=48074 RepID=A0A6P1TCX9_9GAMM|nr:extracellular solute-binding protein [Microbulbifer hydrolyticus]MBB5209907.1 iron(III) transport system substrate-binding protein [Microbulbifer hydrolyticus]QHQ39555.1 extracellular solute-binding protein [Microbulbifer hydrolyticus]
MQRRAFLHNLAAVGAISCLPISIQRSLAAEAGAVSVDELPKLEGDLTLYLGRGEGGLYENVLEAIRKRNPNLNLQIRRGATAALANSIVAEAKAGVRRADVFWAVDSGAVGLVSDAGLARPLPADLTGQLKPGFRYPQWAPVSGRIRTLPYNTERLTPDQIPDSVMALADSEFAIGWAPAYASFQSFVTAMRLLQGEKATEEWLRGVSRNATSYAGELGVVMAVERGEVDLGFANHYYTLRLKNGKPDAKVDLAFTNNDAGCLVNASGILALSEGDLPINFIRYLLTREVQSYLATEAYEIPLVNGVKPPQGLPPLSTISPPKVDLTQLADLRPTLNLMRRVGVL